MRLACPRRGEQGADVLGHLVPAGTAQPADPATDRGDVTVCDPAPHALLEAIGGRWEYVVDYARRERVERGVVRSRGGASVRGIRWPAAADVRRRQYVCRRKELVRLDRVARHELRGEHAGFVAFALSHER